jgi:hypothetical protein
LSPLSTFPPLARCSLVGEFPLTWSASNACAVVELLRPWRGRYCGIRKRAELSDDNLAQLRERASAPQSTAV